MKELETWFERMPVVGILRGVKPDEVIDIGEALYKAGIGIIEVPLNSPEPLESINKLSVAMGDRCIVGAGTVLTVKDADNVADAGGVIAVTPNTNTAVIKRSLERGMTPMPGWATATDAFEAYDAGARYLKLFPAATYGVGHVKAVSAVLPDDVRLLAVGGAGASNIQEWLDAGVDGFGMATNVYKPGFSAGEVFQRACEIVDAVKSARNG